MKKSVSTATTSSSSYAQHAEENKQKGKEETTMLGMIPQRLDFTQWLKTLSFEERSFAIQVKNAQLVRDIKNSYKRVEKIEEKNEWESPFSASKAKGFPKSIKVKLAQQKILFQSLVFLSVDSYLDTIGFDMNVPDLCDRLYDILVTKNFQGPLISTFSFQTVSSREEWIQQIIKFLRYNIFHSYSSWDTKLLEVQKNCKKELSTFWKNLSENQKEKLLLLGESDFESFFPLLKLISIDLLPCEVEKQIKELMKLDHTLILNRILKCKLRKSIDPLYDYYQHIYSQCREGIEKKRKKIKKRKIKRERKKSVGGQSSKTNYTEHKNIVPTSAQEIVLEKVEYNLLQFYDYISQEANSLHQRRVLGFQRIQTLIGLQNCPIKLFGSCKNAIALKNSDIDIVIDKVILNNFEFMENPQTRVASALECVNNCLSGIPWIIEKKFIKTAKIPIIKLIIDTEIPVQEYYIPECYCQLLNRYIDNHGLVNIDLTIETPNHLGIISTDAITNWLGQIPTLRVILLLFKHFLAKNSLNENYTCGLNTYSLIVMLIACIYDSGLTKQTRIGVVLQRLLRFYGWQFDEKIHKIDIRNKKNIFQKKFPNDRCAQLQICDPLNDGFIMTKKCYKFKEIQELFRQIWTKSFYQVQCRVEEMIESGKQVQEIKEIMSEERQNYFLLELN